MRTPNLQSAQQVSERVSYSNLLTAIATRGHTGTVIGVFFDAYERDLRGPIEQRAMRELQSVASSVPQIFFFLPRSIASADPCKSYGRGDQNLNKKKESPKTLK